MADNRTKNVVKNSTASILQKLVQIICQFALRTAFIYLLGNEYTGVSGLFTDILQVLSLMELGLDSSMIFSLYEPLAKHDSKRISSLLSFYKSAFTVIGITVLVAGLICTPFIPRIINGVPNIKEDIRGIFLMYVLTTASSYFLIYKSVLLRADQKSRIISKWTSVVLITECISEIIVLLVLREFYAYLIIHFISTIGINIIISRISAKIYCEYFSYKEAALLKHEKVKLFKDLACLTVYNFSGVIINSTDSIFISAFVGTTEVAVIGNFTLIMNGVRAAVSQIVNATKPSIGNLAATSSNNKQEEIFNRMNFISFWVACFCCNCLFNLMNPFIGDIWFNTSYTISMDIIAVMVANFFIAVMVFPVESFRTANGLFVQGWMRPAVMAILNIILDFILGRQYGIIGIFLATTVSRLTTQVWYDPWLVYSKVFRKSVTRFYSIYVVYAFITAITCLLTYYICKFADVDSVFMSFILKMAASFIIPNTIIVALFRNSEDFRYVSTLIYKIMKRS